MSGGPGAALSRGSIELAERGWLPDSLVRWGIRQLLSGLLEELEAGGAERQQAFVQSLHESPIALAPDLANEQHYEVPSPFFRLALGPRLKYSGCLFASPDTSLAEAEEAMLALSCERAGLQDGMDLLDLGCGWGSLSLFVAERFPRCRVLAVSNSKVQREHIVQEAQRRGLSGVEVVTADANRFEPARDFDRVMSVEMFEHMRNWPQLLGRIASWLRPEGRLFLHVFSHARHAYPYEDRGRGDWMARNFFSGGIMPSQDLLAEFDDDLAVEESWRIDGSHYHRTCDAWLAKMDAAREAVVATLESAEPGGGERAYRRWRLFFLACSELFAYRGGTEWGVSHYRLARRRPGSANPHDDAARRA